MKKFFKTKTEKEQFLFWIATLESGVLKKGRNALQDDTGGYCCLGVGVACTVKDPLSHSDTNRLYGEFPANNAPGWLQEINDDFESRTGVQLSYLNDGNRSNFTGKYYRRPKSHKYIAKRLWEVYRHEFES